jgi:CheY-like chemotaxis protein
MRILLMDDNDLVRMSLSRMLIVKGYETDVAKDGSQAIDNFIQSKSIGNTPDLVILDLTVPGGMGAIETVKRLHKIEPELKAMVISGYTEDPIMTNYSDYGFCAAIKKPVTSDEMSAIISKAMCENKSAR